MLKNTEKSKAQEKKPYQLGPLDIEVSVNPKREIMSETNALC